MNREIIEFEVEGIGEFKIYSESTVREDFKINSLLVDIYGSQIKFLNAQLDITNLEKIFEDLKAEDKIPIDRAEEYAKLRVIRSIMDESISYATLKVRGVSLPERFEDVNKEELTQICEAWEVASQEYFRSKQKERVI
jgi:hypothetical protein